MFSCYTTDDIVRSTYEYEILLQGPHKDFESIKKVDENGVEYWEARQLLPLLGYPNWQKAEELIGRAARSCINSGQDVDNHFVRASKMVEIGSNTVLAFVVAGL